MQSPLRVSKSPQSCNSSEIAQKPHSPVSSCGSKQSLNCDPYFKKNWRYIFPMAPRKHFHSKRKEWGHRMERWDQSPIEKSQILQLHGCPLTRLVIPSGLQQLWSASSLQLCVLWNPWSLHWASFPRGTCTAYISSISSVLRSLVHLRR